MSNSQIIQFFDSMAARWDEHSKCNDSVIGDILDKAQIDSGTSVLDVACGTGVLVPFYLNRNVSMVTAVDISPNMVCLAKQKCTDPRVTFVCADILQMDFSQTFDRCLVYNALPHFFDPDALLEALSRLVSKGGRLTIAHGASLKTINGCHKGAASHVSRGLMSDMALKKIMEPFFVTDVMISTDDRYIVSGVKR